MKLTAALITLGEPTLEAAVASVRDHVDEVCIVYTGDDSDTYTRVAALANSHAWHKPEGGMDFALMRNRSFAMATGDWIVWLDSDDTVHGAEYLRDACKPDKRIVCPYEYAIRDDGHVDILQARERIVPNDGKWHWVHPVHETIVRKDGVRPEDLSDLRITWKHHRKHEDKGRNLAILEAYARSHDADAWLHMNLGLELHAAWRYEEALARFHAYMLVSNLDDEKVMACLHAAECELAPNPLDEKAQERALVWVRRAQALRPKWFDPYFAEAKVYALPGFSGNGDPESLRKVVSCCRMALGTVPTVTAVATRPTDRTHRVHEMLKDACDHLCDWRGAADATAQLLKMKPGDPGLEMSRKRYERFARDEEPEAVAPTIERVAPAVSVLTYPKPVRAVGTKRVLHMILSNDVCGIHDMDPRSAGSEAMGGGSRAGFHGLVKAMGKLGTYEVHAFSGYLRDHDEVDGVYYHKQEYLRSIEPAHRLGKPDVALGYYDVRHLYGVQADLRIGSHHTLHPWFGWEWIDLNTAPSAHAVEHLKRCYRPNSPWAVLPNAVEGLDGVVRKPVPGRVIYHTSPDRGLHHLLHAWPEIRRRVPHATLHIGGDPDGIAGYADFASGRGCEVEMGKAVRSGLEVAARAGGVVKFGRVTRDALLNEIAEASVFAFPCEVLLPCETFSISLLECCQIGVPIVLAPEDSLESIYKGAVRMTPSPVREHLREFVDAVVDVLTRPEEAERLSAAGKKLAAQYSFARTARVLDAMISDWFAQREEVAA